ncbi:MFS transporter [Ligilactobacillus apodemi]|uniref:Major facilitator superfamily (MFS) profile domain-containing protein n=1 Tax=Ligilactobacillus apodemi DSM 16634 = JCM 16172 TaxID=1423724 RepID=A0A0R1TYA0_9LACO|nr:MFS transporter [Ligilactobacillus apodemi]KRL83811.1 hypothetical protein FC32_GL001073 [Ligilactobacillus apodemi DSM 16634 = JCM 16172]
MRGIIYEKSFVLFIVSDFISQFSAGIVLAAMNWYIIDMYRSNTLIATFANINVVAGLLISIIAVVLLRKVNLKRVGMISYCFRIIFIVLPLLLFSVGVKNHMAIYLLALSNGIGWNLYFPASKDILNSFTLEKNVLEINSFAEISMQVGLFSSALVSGILYHYIGFINILIIGTLLFIGSFFIFTLIKYNEPIETDLEDKTKIISYLLEQKWLILLGLVLYIPFIGANIINTSLPGYIQEHLAGNSISYGFTDTMYGIGACLAGILLPNYCKIYPKRSSYFAIVSHCCNFRSIFSINRSLTLGASYIFLLGLVGPAIRTVIYTRAMEFVPSNLLGAVVSFWNFVNLIFQFGVNYSVGKIMDHVGAQWGFMVYVSLMILGALIFSSIKKPYKYVNNNKDHLKERI